MILDSKTLTCFFFLFLCAFKSKCSVNMKRMKNPIAVMLVLLAIISVGCKKTENNNHDSLLKLTTISPYDITQTSAVCGSEVVVSENVSLTELGICWGTENNLTLENAHLSTTDWNKPFLCSLTDLEPNTKYYVRAYALQGVMYYYGDEKSFTTENNGGGEGGGESGDDDEFTYVDLGLPSGILWAECNVGATVPEEFGSYFAWGETQPKDYYDWNTYKFGTDWNMFTKYCTDPDLGLNGFVDSLVVLEPEDDAATVILGNGWRMPTKEEWTELMDNTTAVWTSENGVKGSRFKASNGNSIFLPAAGRRWADGFYDVQSYGNYWSSSLSSEGSFFSWSMNFYSNWWPYVESKGRYLGLTVRPVRSAR